MCSQRPRHSPTRFSKKAAKLGIWRYSHAINFIDEKISNASWDWKSLLLRAEETKGDTYSVLGSLQAQLRSPFLAFQIRLSTLRL